MNEDFAVPRGLYSRETALDVTGGPQFVRRGEVVFARPDVSLYRLDDFPESFRRRPAAHVSRHPLIQLPFHLPQLPRSSRFLTVDIDVAFDAPGATVLWLKPPTTDIEVLADDELPAAVTADDLQVPSGGLVRRNVVTTWGTGDQAVRWLFEAQPGAPVRQGDAVVRAMLEVPRPVTEIPILVRCSVEVEIRRLDAVEPVTAFLTEPAPYRVALGSAP